MCFAATPAKAEDIVPLSHGFYVASETPCEKASNATIIVYDGLSFGHEKMINCRPPSVTKLGSDSYRVVESCQDAESLQENGGPWDTLTDTYKILSFKEFIETNSYGSFAFRYCPQADMPVFWQSLKVNQ
jgi:hypothetical protein